MMKKLLFLFLLIPFGLSAQIIPPLNDSTAIGTPGAAYTPSIRVVTYGGKTLFQVRVGTSAKWMTMSTTQYDRNYVQLNGGNSITGSQSIFGNVSINNGSLQSTINGASWSSPNGNIINLADGGAFVDLNIKSSNSVKIVSRHNAQPGTDRTIEFKGDSIIKSSTGKNALFDGDVASFTTLNSKLDSVYQRTVNLYTNQFIGGDKTLSGTLTTNGALQVYGPLNTFGNVTLKAPGTMFEVQGSGYGLVAVDGALGNYVGFNSSGSSIQYSMTSGGLTGNGLLKWSNVTGSKTLYLPNKNDTIAVKGDIPGLGGYVPYTGATSNITSTFAISAKNYTASGTAGTGYYDVISQATSPASASGHLRIYSDSLNRLSWKNSTYRRTLQVPFLSDVTVRFPYKATPTLADSTDVANVYKVKSDSTAATGYQTVGNFFPKADPRYVNVTGDNMTGALNIVSVNPQLALNYDGINTATLGTNSGGYLGIVASMGTYIGGTGPTASPFNISSSLQSSAANQFQFGGSTTVNYVAAFRKPTAFTLPDNSNFAANVFGAVNFTRAAGAAYNIANVVVKPLAAGGGTTAATISASLWVDGPSTGSTGAARNRSIYVLSGTSEFGGDIQLSTFTAGAGSVGYFSANGTLVQTAAGTTSQVLIGGSTPSFGTVPVAALPNKYLRLTASGTGAATTISVAHGQTGVTSASQVFVTAKNAASGGYLYVTTDATNINIVYAVAPAAGTNNLSFDIEIKP